MAESQVQKAAKTAVNAATAVVEAGVSEPNGKKKKKYSRSTKQPQKLEVAVSRGLHRLANAVEEGLGNWRKNRDSSARKRRDGAIRDAAKNYGKAVTKFHKAAASFPKDVMKAVPSVGKILKSSRRIY